MPGPWIEILLGGIFCLLALALLFRVAMAAKRLRRSDSEVLGHRSERRRRLQPKWLTRALAYAIGFVVLTAGLIELFETGWIRRWQPSARPEPDAER